MMDEKYQVAEKTKSALAVAEQKASSAGSAIMSNPYVMTGASWVSNAFTAVAKAAEDVSVITKDKLNEISMILMLRGIFLCKLACMRCL